MSLGQWPAKRRKRFAHSSLDIQYVSVAFNFRKPCSEDVRPARFREFSVLIVLMQIFRCGDWRMPIWKRIGNVINGEIAFGFFCSALFWLAVLGWATSYAPDPERRKLVIRPPPRPATIQSNAKLFGKGQRPIRSHCSRSSCPSQQSDCGSPRLMEFDVNLMRPKSCNAPIWGPNCAVCVTRMETSSLTSLS